MQAGADDATGHQPIVTAGPARGFMNRVMRKLGVSDVGPEFPRAAGALRPVEYKGEAEGSGAFHRCGPEQAAAIGLRWGPQRTDEATAGGRRRRISAADCRVCQERGQSKHATRGGNAMRLK